MTKKLSKLFFSSVKRAVRMQRRALKQVGMAAATKTSKSTKKRALKRVPTRRSTQPAAAKTTSAGKGNWQNFIHKPAIPGRDVLGRLGYSLYRPKGYAVAGLPLVIMLHGCQQTAEDMAQGTRMNQLADHKGFVVAYPQQTKLIQPMRCWRWFQPDARHGLAEADTIADLARTIVSKYRLDSARVYVAGLSAGAGMAGLVALRHPDLFAAVAMHSGALLGASHSAASGLQVMRQGSATDPAELIKPLVNRELPFPGLPAMILHGKRDRIVSMRNAVQLAQQFSYVNNTTTAKESVMGGGTHREYDRRDFLKDGRVAVRLCLLGHVGHGWSGGDGTLKFHSDKGPRASVLIWQFFSMHHHSAP